MLSELSAEIRSAVSEMKQARSDTSAEMKQARSDMSAELAAVRAEMAQIRSELSQEVHTVVSKIAQGKSDRSVSIFYFILCYCVCLTISYAQLDPFSSALGWRHCACKVGLDSPSALASSRGS